MRIVACVKMSQLVHLMWRGRVPRVKEYMSYINGWRIACYVLLDMPGFAQWVDQSDSIQIDHRTESEWAVDIMAGRKRTYTLIIESSFIALFHSWKFGRTRKRCGNTCLRPVFPQQCRCPKPSLAFRFKQ